MNSKFTLILYGMIAALNKIQNNVCICVLVLACLLLGQSTSAQAISYQDLTAQEQADFSRWLGWVWGDGRPTDLDALTGVRYTGPSNNTFSNRYDAVVTRLLDSNLGIVLGNGGTNTRRVLEPWNYWIDGIPGGNDNEAQILRDAVRNPNFLAGIVDTEGGNCGNTNNNYYIDDHFFAPSHPDSTKLWGLLYFQPGRMIELYHLLGNTYGFEKTAIQIGTQGQKFLYGIESEREQGIMAVYEGYNDTQQINEAAANVAGGTTKRVRIYIDNEDWATLRSYGYWNFPNRYPGCNDPVDALSGTFPLVDLPLANPKWLDDCELLENGSFDQGDLAWNALLFQNADATFTFENGLAEIEILEMGTAGWHINLRQTNLVFEQGKSYRISFDAYADDPRSISVIARSDQGNGGYYFGTQSITTELTRYTHEFTMTANTDPISYLSFNLGNQMAHTVYFDNMSLQLLNCECPVERFVNADIANSVYHFESSDKISADNIIYGYDIKYDAGNQIELDADFQVVLGATFEAFIDGCLGE